MHSRSTSRPQPSHRPARRAASFARIAAPLLLLVVPAVFGPAAADAQVLYCGKTLAEWRDLAVNVIDERAVSCQAGHTIRGTNGPDLILGTPCADDIDGGRGEDCIYGFGGNDHLRGRPGDDEIHGGAGNDRIYGDSGHDRLYGEAQDDYIKGESGTDTLYGGGGHDVLYGGAGRDVLFGGPDHDELWGDSGRDRVYGGGGGDYIRGDAGKDLLCGGGADDAIYGDSGGDDIDGGPGTDRCDGGDRLLFRWLRNNDCWRCSSIDPPKSCDAKSGSRCPAEETPWCADGVQAVAGTCDGGVGCGEGGGRERSAPGPALYQLLYDRSGGAPIDFDEIPGRDGVPAPGHFGHTFQDLPPDLCGGTLDLTLLPGADGLEDDRVGLGLVGQGFAHTADPGLSPGGPQTVSYDLASLPGVLGAMVDGSLDVAVADGTGVDCIRLCVQTGCPFDCPPGSQQVTDHINLWWTEKIPTTEPTTDCEEVLAAAALQGIDLEERFADICARSVPGSVPARFEPRTCSIRTDALGPFNATIVADGCCTVPDPPDLALDKTVAAARPELFTLTVTNRGAGATSGPISVTDTLPPGARFVGASGQGWTCTEDPADPDEPEAPVTVVCEHDGPVAPGASLPPLTLEIAPPYAAGENCARVDTPDDADRSNDRACVEIACPESAVRATAFRMFETGDCNQAHALALSPDILDDPESIAACRDAGGGAPILGAALQSCEVGGQGETIRAEIELCCGKPTTPTECPAGTEALDLPVGSYATCEEAQAQVPQNPQSFSRYCRRLDGASGEVAQASVIDCVPGEDGVRADVRLCCALEEPTTCEPGSVQATAGGLHYPRPEYGSCAEAIAHAESPDRLTSYHYRNACQKATGGDLPGQVDGARVIDCTEDRGSFVVEVDVCCPGGSGEPGDPCESDRDCAPDRWCRPTQEGDSECIDFGDEGDRCLGHVTPWALQRCGPGLICTDWPEPTHDIPGFCRKPDCTTDADCAPDGWCRPTQDGGDECVDYTGEGGRCLGYVAPWTLQRCAPGLVCTDWPEPTHDIPGFCRQPDADPPCWGRRDPPDADGPDNPYTYYARAAARPSGDDGQHLLLTVDPGDGEPVEEVRLDLPRRTARAVEAAHLPSGWVLERDGSTIILRGPAQEPPVHLKLDTGGRRLPDELDFEVRSGGELLARHRNEAVAELPPVDPARSVEGLVVLPREVHPGETIQIRAVDPERTPAGGRWTIGGQVLGRWDPMPAPPCLADLLRDPVWLLRVPDTWTAGEPVEVTYMDPWGDLVADVPDADVTIGEPVGETTTEADFVDTNGNDVWDEGEPFEGTAPVPEITGGSDVVHEGGQACVCGAFPDTASRTGLLLDGLLAGLPLTASSRVAYLELPDSLELGRHTVAGWEGAGFAPAEPRSFDLVRVSASLDQEELFRGGSTSLALRVEGTETPVRLRLRNHTPGIVRLEGGEDQTVTTSGGTDNRATLTVTARERGRFNIEWELPGCPCDGGEEDSGYF